MFSDKFMEKVDKFSEKVIATAAIVFVSSVGIIFIAVLWKVVSYILKIH